ncbi:TetR/AcrR family transcriptional regulator [Pseudoflavitalea sp. G-6-1-2]|uniref:TetR/AcrR family transcriptional regulator n=1 Tax=Pseudoflavitalea sp. G-6-1-2 TaxID=2728841 RepID=UPI00146CF62E|nr:TetR/AcrR family transcriptional regulator [Pseudoflavitalea sp. G-6-1-2]NML21879.1 TetR/AcrR family transcriptional regulator [Pseudoflavitalea sp. G-6-1-2]
MRTRDENKIAAIKEKAIELMVSDGLDGFSIQKLAKAAGVSPATIYIYYKDKEDLIVQLSTDLTYKMLDHSMQGFDPEMDFAEGMRLQWKNRANHCMKYPLELAFIEHIRYSPLYEKTKAEMTARFKDEMGRFVHCAIKNKQLHKLPFEVYWSVAFAPLYQLIKFHSQGRSHKNEHFVLSNKLLMQTCDLVIKALTP